MLRLPRKLQLLLWKRRKSIAPATQTDMTTCLETFEKEFCSFPHRNGDATGKPETRDETRGRSKASISCETSPNFDTFGTLSNRLECHKVPRLPSKTTWQPAWKPSKRKVFAASPKEHGEATGKPETRDETRGSIKTSISCETSSNFLVNLPITSKSMFRARLPSICITSYKMPRLPRTLHLVATWRSPDNAIRKSTQHDTSTLRLPRKMKMDTSKVLCLPRELQRIFWKRRKSIAPATQNDFRHVTKHVWMSRSATAATRNEATRHAQPPKVTPFAELTVYGHCHTGLARTVANGCGRLGNVERNTLNP